MSQLDGSAHSLIQLLYINQGGN